MADLAENLRAHTRTSMFVVAKCAAASMSDTVKIRNMSLNGALIEGQVLPAMGEAIVLQRGDLQIAGRIAWLKGGKAGVHFDANVAVADWLPNRSRVQGDVDRDFQRLQQTPKTTVRLPADRLAKPPPTAEDMEKLALALDSLGSDLAGDPDVIGRHMMKLQTLDIASQMLRALACGKESSRS